MSKEFHALELRGAATNYRTLLGVTKTRPEGSLLHPNLPKGGLRRWESAAEGLGLYLDYVMFDAILNDGCYDPQRLAQTVTDHLALIIQTANEPKPQRVK
ncbi:hypothetical protein [Deinococcus marmoris]|uniref:Uncharacterized protein n=1 Tax=Deinococcus marmoris TaxID=249408 RepID=A0A1U7NZ09_9DEIO|nr:hypothetical protein [Deinococcus marmoris]OLV18155.1 hypothetical protein BOO71_0006676 [Deinococcus marmoris]